MQKIITFLWFDQQAEEAAKFYCSVFKNSKILSVSHYGAGAPMPAGTVLTVAFQINGHEFTALNGGPQYHFTEAVSLAVMCDSQEEIDHYWQALTANGGEPGPCGWLKDKYGLSWQVVPSKLEKLLTDPNPAKSSAVMQAMMPMQKLDIATLQRAHDSVG
jgi:predicted 3-demethylubiquinone-9 3-methyltransferase (glyoxalase superfamily)